jgi:hypothetical protein
MRSTNTHPTTIMVTKLARRLVPLNRSTRGQHRQLINLYPVEHVRVLLETIVGQYYMVKPRNVIHKIGLVSNHDQLMHDGWRTACPVANFAFIPQIFDAMSISHLPLDRKDFTWIRRDTALCIPIHLDDERCLKTSISHLINAILEQKDDPSDYSGVAFSACHCAVVKSSMMRT